jgi:hypothetical protein
MNSRITTAKEKCIRLRTLRDVLEKEHKEESKRLRKMHVQRNHCKNAIVVLEYIIQRDYGDVVKLFEDTISAGLKDLFNHKYNFKFEISRRGDSCTCDFEVITDQCAYYQNIQMTQGTALKEIISVLVRMIICKLDNNMPDFVILDEPFGGVRDFRQDIAHRFLMNVCEHFGIQIIMVTQNQEAIAHKVLRLENVIGKVLC